MFVKLALTNAKKSIKDYLIYFITITLSVSLFYAFVSLSSSNYELITEESLNFNLLKDILKYSTFVITGLLIILIGYVNNYVMKRRQREFATYILLGIEQKSVAIMFFVETLIMGIVAVGFGIILGTFFSQVVTALVLLTAKQEIIFEFKLYIDTIFITVIFFLLMFLIIGLYNVKRLKKLKIINMLNMEKKSQFKFKRSGKIYSLVFIASIGLYSICGYCIYNYIVSKKAATDIVVISVTGDVILSLISFILGTYALFYSLAYIIIFIKERWINFKYENTNLVLLGGIVSKIKTAPILMATITITFLGAAISFVLTLVMSQWSLGFLEYRAPFDVNIKSEYRIGDYFDITNIEDIPKMDYDEIISYLNKENNLKEYNVFEKYFINKEDFNIKEKIKMPILAIKLSDFNKLRDMLGYETIELKGNEFAMQWQKTSSEEERNKFIEKNSEINIGNKNFKINNEKIYLESIGEGAYNLYTDALIILQDEACKDLALASTDFYGNIKKNMTYDKAVEFEYDYILNWLEKDYNHLIEKYGTKKISTFTNTNIKSLEESEILNATLAMRMLGIYLGVVLLMISLTVLALKQLEDSMENKKGFDTLRKLGVEEKEINKIVLKQISIYFVMPIFIAMIGVIIFVINFFNLYAEEINSYIGDTAFVVNIVIALIIIVTIYIVYFLATYSTFKRNIKEAF